MQKERGFVNIVSSSRHICNNVDFMFAGVIFMLMISTTTAIKCYVCGTGAELPFEETKDLSINATHIKLSIHSSCEEFDRVDPSEKERYALDCPKDFHACMLQIDEEDVVRTCSNVLVDDCKPANNIHYCYCKTRDYCNIENAESIKERYEAERLAKPNSEIDDDEDSVESSGMEDNSREMDESKDNHHHNHRHHLTSTPPSTVTVQSGITIAETTIKTIHNSAIKNNSTKTCLILFITFISSIVFL